jgi:hypothetical protein
VKELANSCGEGAGVALHAVRAYQSFVSTSNTPDQDWKLLNFFVQTSIQERKYWAMAAERVATA